VQRVPRNVLLDLLELPHESRPRQKARSGGPEAAREAARLIFVFSAIKTAAEVSLNADYLRRHRTQTSCCETTLGEAQAAKKK
jgi:hypothetical protein